MSDFTALFCLLRPPSLPCPSDFETLYTRQIPTALQNLGLSQPSIHEFEIVPGSVFLPQPRTLMTLSEGGSFEGPSNVPPDQHFFIPLSSENDSSLSGDSEEWEHEYSTTEVETYYLTLDLTTPSIPCVRPHVPRAGRGGYRSTWINPGLRRQKRHLEVAPTISLPKGDPRTSLSSPTSNPTPVPDPAPITFADGENLEEDALDDDDVEEQQEPIQSSANPPPVAKDLPESTSVKKPERIQILDLHTDNPIIAYKAHTFSCSWAENIGTELLFTFRDSERPIPALRSLADDVELLAASSARIISKSVKFIPKDPVHVDPVAEYAEQGERSVSFRDPKTGGITIPVGSGASNSRKEQARFLERMMEIKQQKGEKDAVTVVAQRRLYPAGWRTLLKEKRAEEQAQLRSMIKKDGDDAQEAAKKLKEMEEEDKRAEEFERLKKQDGILKKSRAGRKSKDVDGARPAKRARGAPLFRRPRGGRARLNLFQNEDSEGQNLEEDSDNESGILSTPTPLRWDERQGHERIVEDRDVTDL